jgi:glyoxylase-like metal-dependent hydrolase (beta-lactamase superfamily II)
MSDRFSRRALLAGSAGCAGHLLTSIAAAPVSSRRRFAARQKGQVVAAEPFGRLERLADGVWALVSTPLEARTTLSNGGIVAGADGVLIVEGFASVEGAQWMAAQAFELTGRRPTHVVLTHYHGDHSGGLAGYRSDADLPTVFYTQRTRGLLETSLQAETSEAESPLSTLAADGIIDDTAEPVRVDLGGRTVSIAARRGHTPSDLTVRVEDPRVVFCGDLVWNEMFPNYVDAIPTWLQAACSELLADERALYVPGHGALADHGEMARYLDLIDHVGAAARRAFERGVSAEQGAAEYAVPASLGEWFMFSPRYHEVAFRAWYRELSG